MEHARAAARPGGKAAAGWRPAAASGAEPPSPARPPPRLECSDRAGWRRRRVQRPRRAATRLSPGPSGSPSCVLPGLTIFEMAVAAVAASCGEP